MPGTAICLLDNDWQDNQQEGLNLRVAIEVYTENVENIRELARLVGLEDGAVTVMAGEPTWEYLDAWLCLLPSARGPDADFRQAFDHAYATHFDLWRRNVPDMPIAAKNAAVGRFLLRKPVKETAEQTLQSPFVRGFGLIPSFDTEINCDFICDVVCTEENIGTNWKFFSCYQDMKLKPANFARGPAGAREISILTWFLAVVKTPRSETDLDGDFVVQSPIKVFIDQELLDRPAFALLKDFAVDGPKAQFEVKPLTDKDFVENENKRVVFVLGDGQRQSLPKAQVTRSVSNETPPVSLSEVNRGRPIQVIVNLSAKKVQMSDQNALFEVPNHPLVLWDCIWEAIYLQARNSK